MEQLLLAWLTRFGAPVLFAAQMLGIFGLPIPDELLLTISGALVREGRLHPVATVLAAIGGSVTGITFSYWLGRTVGLRAIHRFIHVDQRWFETAQRWFLRFGRWLLVFGYFIPGVRHVTAIAAGSAPLDFRTFAVYAYPGAVIWCGTFLTLGFVTEHKWREVLHAARGHLALVAILVVAGLAAYALISGRRASASPRA